MDYSTPNPTEIYDSLLQEYDSVFSASRCLAAGFESAAQSAWAQLGGPKSKAGFMKFGDADEGLLSVYPGVKYCDMSEGSSFAPWSAGSLPRSHSGPFTCGQLPKMF